MTDAVPVAAVDVVVAELVPVDDVVEDAVDVSFLAPWTPLFAWAASCALFM